MDMIGRIQYTENKLDGRKPNQGKERSAQKHPLDEAEEASVKADANCSPSEYDVRLGRKLDTIA